MTHLIGNRHVGAGALHRAGHVVQHVFADRFGAFNELRLLIGFGIVHQRGIDQIVTLGVRAQNGLDGSHDRQREERAESSEQGTERQHRQERHRIVDVHGALGDLRREDEVLDLLVDADERQNTQSAQHPAVDPSEQDRQRAADIGAEHRDELRCHTAEQRQRHPVRHIQQFQADGGEESVEQCKNRSGEQKRGDLRLTDRPYEQKTALRFRSHPLAGGTTQLRPCRGNVERGHHDGHQVKQEREQARHRAHCGSREIGDPGCLDVLEDLTAEAVDLGKLEIGVLTDQITDLPV